MQANPYSLPSPSAQTLTVDGVALEGQFEDTLASLGIVGGAHIGVSDRLRGGTMPISIKTLQLGGAVDFFMVDPSFTIRDIKLLIQDKRGFPPEQQRLVFDCQRLEDDNTLSYYNIQEHNCLNLLHLSGLIVGGGLSIEVVFALRHPRPPFIQEDPELEAEAEAESPQSEQPDRLCLASASTCK